MNFGIYKENPQRERRVALTPAGVQSLVSCGHNVYVEKDAGIASHFSNEKYETVGAKIVYTNDEVFGRSDILLKISPPTDADCERLEETQTLFSFLHLPIASTSVLKTILQKHICAIGYELIEDANGDLPILSVMSEIAGQMITQIAARFLESNNHGRGIVLGGITGIPPATVVILGAGMVGSAAARMALCSGAEVIVLDKDLGRLRKLEQRFNYQIVTGLTTEYNIRKAIQFADVVVGAVLMKGEKAPHLVTEDMIQQMKPGAIVIDVSIDQGGCIATSRPTTLEDPTYVLHNVIHYCVPNIPANVARTATYGLTNTLLPYLLEICQNGLESSMKENGGLARGVCIFNGECCNDAIAKRFGMQSQNIETMLKVQREP